VQEALSELETCCDNPECQAVVRQPWKKRRVRYCSTKCAARARYLSEFERSKDAVSKVCRQCGEDKMLNCQTCMKKQRRSQYEKRGGKEYVYKQNLINRYGMTLEEYYERVAAQGGRCAVCNDEPKGRLDVDHDHQTGVVRALLCGPCNRALGNARDDPDRLRALISYLEHHGIPHTSSRSTS
jgi:hypothetical protein